MVRSCDTWYVLCCSDDPQHITFCIAGPTSTHPIYCTEMDNMERIRIVLTRLNLYISYKSKSVRISRQRVQTHLATSRATLLAILLHCGQGYWSKLWSYTSTTAEVTWTQQSCTLMFIPGKIAIARNIAPCVGTFFYLFFVFILYKQKQNS